MVTNIQEAKVLISSSKVTDRTNGLKDLIHILKFNHGKTSLEALTNKAYLALCETLFQCLRDERSSYLKSKAKTSRTGALLPLAANAVRQVISTGVRSLKVKTVEFIINSISEVLPGRNGTLVQPLLEDLPKALKGLLEHQPHVERLTNECWDATVDFCLAALAFFCAEPDTDHHNSLSTDESSRRRSQSRTPFESTDLISSKVSSRDLPMRKAVPDAFIHPAEDFVHCLLLLTKASNAPLLEKAEQILTTMIRLLQCKAGRSHLDALAVVNFVIARTTLHSIQLTKLALKELVPVAKALWSDASLRDEILITLMHTEMHILSILADENEDVFSFDLESLVETIYGDYRRRQEHTGLTGLQFLEDDNLCFRHIGSPQGDTHPLNTYAFSMETEYVRQESLWATVAAIARFSFMIDHRKRAISSKRDEEEHSAVKRLRITNSYQDYLRDVSEPKSNAKRAALQVIAFMLHEGALDEEDLQSTLDKLTSYISDENPAHSSWAMIALAAAAFQEGSRHPRLLPSWISVWQSASRAVTSVSSSRAACHLMDVLLRMKIVPFSAVSETVQSMLLSIELSGPALLTEASSSLLTTLIRQRVAENPTHYNQTSERVLSWLLSKWTPSYWPERNYSSLNARHCNARDILRLLHACLDRPFIPLDGSAFLVLGPISQARVQTLVYRDLERYLLHLPSQEEFRLSYEPDTVSLDSATPKHLPTQPEARLLDFVNSEMERASQRWKEWTQENPQGVNVDMMRIITNFCIVSSALCGLSNADQRRIEALESAVEGLTQTFVYFLQRRETEQYKIDAVLEICTKSLPDIRHLTTLSQLPFKEVGIFSLACSLSNALDSRKDSKQSFHVDDDDDDDFMDIDGAQNSPVAGVSSQDFDIPRHNLQAKTDAGALRATCSAYFHFISFIPETSTETSPDTSTDEQGRIPSEFVDYITSISEAELLQSREFVSPLLSTPHRMHKDSCMNLFERLGESLLGPGARDYNTSEVANGMVMEVFMGASLDLDLEATDRQGQNLGAFLVQIYTYYVKMMELDGVRRSPDLQKTLANFLHVLLQHHPNFGQNNHKLPSVRTSLFELLAHGEIAVKYHIAERLPTIFENFILSEHDKILQDVDSSLPSESEWNEGIAIRLLVLAKLISRWNTLLRQGVYHIFATAGSVENAIQHARQCIQDVAAAKKLGSSQALFRLFAPQIIFTWLERPNKFSAIPYLTFDYPSLRDLLLDVESEAVGQAIMFGRKEELDYLATMFGTSTSAMLEKNFSKAAAYTISWDTAKGFARDKSIPSTIALLVEILKPSNYLRLILEHFPRVLGHIIQTLYKEESISKQFERKPEYSATAVALSEMNTYGHSSQDFDLGIEPSFKAYFLFDQMDRLCRRMPPDIKEAKAPTLWKPDNYTYIMRMLLDRLHPALGSIHARSIIRKIRILVALAGTVALEGYPLQMTLQSLRPYLTDSQCAEDTFGIVRYLFHNGVEYLRNHLSFVTGIGLSILISLRVFLGSSQESTTQQSQHTATMSKAQEFHHWFTKYLFKEYLTSYAQSIPNEEKSSIDAFKRIITAASQIRIEGNSRKDSGESTLLIEILEDVRCHRNLLNNTSREVALNLLCQDFTPASSAREDVLYSDEDIVKYAPQVWDSCQRSNVGEGYMLWAARVIGRAFSVQGEVKRKAYRSRPWSAQPQELPPKASPGQNSKDVIVQKIGEMLYSDNRKHVSLAEDAVRLFLNRLKGTSATKIPILPKHIVVALDLTVRSETETGLPALSEALEYSANPSKRKPVFEWIRDLTVSLCHVASGDPILGSLSQLLLGVDDMAETLFPYILHLVLLEEYDTNRNVRDILSDASMSWFCGCDTTTAPYVRILIQAILYLRSQPVPKEVTRVDRDRWLEFDYLEAAQAATVCGMYRTSLLFMETSSGQPIVKPGPRRSSVLIAPPEVPVDLQLSVYKNLDEPDSFYGVERASNLASVLDRFDYEGDGIKSLLFRGARLDSQIRRSNASVPADARGMVKSLVTLNMNSISHFLLSTDQFRDLGDDAVESTLHTARKLGQWDIKAPEGTYSESGALFKAFQGLHYASDSLTATTQVHRQLITTMNVLSGKDKSSTSTKSLLRTLAALTEVDEVVNMAHDVHLLDEWDKMKSRENWMRAGDFDDVRIILSCRETLFAVLSSNTSLQLSTKTRTGTLRHLEVEALVQSSIISRKHGALQESLSSVTYLSDIVKDCKAIGLNIEGTAAYEVANVLWDQGEAETSIRMRQDLIKQDNFDSQVTELSMPVLLAELGHHLADARLANADTIIKDYLEPAIKGLKGLYQGTGPGQVFHQFALFCDKQLQSPDAAEEFSRAKKSMDRRRQEFEDYEKLGEAEKSRTMKLTYQKNATRTKNWFKLEEAEYKRQRKSRDQILHQCLQNYLLSLQAGDEYNNDALRVFSLWLEYCDTPLANEAVKPHLPKVPSRKFALLMNQLSSRLQAETSPFQLLLSQLVLRICIEHPYHGMYQIFAIQMKIKDATSREEVVRSKDESARSRQRSATEIAKILRHEQKSGEYWAKIYQSAEIYHNLAMVKNEADNKTSGTGKELTLEKYAESKALVKKIPALKVPPATLAVEVRANCDYTDLPKIVGFEHKMSIANGLSMPKIITAKGSDGRKYKQLFKSGNDDLRQDAIMEQVFDQVSRVLKNHTTTRLRNLGIRSYKVLPLSTRSGLMEFVPNTIPLNAWIMPAHEKYYPTDWKQDKCRKHMQACQGDIQSTRVKVYQNVENNFHPVLRYFLLERFQDPDEWFERRLAYTRSTAAISILGWVLGLGDRHCHNILLDEKSGEVVHIDLGVSFEAGRVLPVPEVVPFRLTRDIVDGFGYTKTEGVFRRCCEFTMDTLREERESIMTLLNVLRYDPLVNWSITPEKVKRMQEGQDTGANGRGTPTPGPAGLNVSVGVSVGAFEEVAVPESDKKEREQEGEAGRALSVVEKKLSKTLSTRATVNELIQQATDERNLAVLYCGWGSYA